VTTSSALRS